MTRQLSAVVALCVVLVCQGIRAQTDAPSPARRSGVSIRTGIYDPGLDARVEALIVKMTLEEKVGQLVQYSAGQPTGPGTNRTDYEDMIAKGQIGALFNISTAKETNAYQHIAVEKSRLRIPIIFGLDVIHGFRTEFPIPLGLAST
jgi:beta-glucosidase